VQAKLSPEEREILNLAGKKLRFWTNAGIVGGFMLFSLPITMRRGVRFRMIQGLAAGTIGIFAVGPVCTP